MNIAGKFKKGLQRAGDAVRGAKDAVAATPVGQGFATSAQVMGASGDRSHSLIPGIGNATDFYKDLAAEGITAKTPMKMAGALGARAVTDLGSDSTRQFYWRHNHPMAILDRGVEQIIGDDLQKAMPNPTMRYATELLAVGAPTALSMGHLDITNPGQAFRPKGFAQNYAEVGSDDRRETGQPGMEIYDRAFLGRRGKPLKYDTAKQEIPDLTKQRYGDYMRHKYQDKGIAGLGIIKGTGANLQGYPEATVFGFPVGLQAAGAAAGGIGGLRLGLNRPGAGRLGTFAAGVAGSALGIGGGKAANMAIAQAQRPDPASTSEYAQMKGQRHLPTQGLY